ncbi:lipoate--protein ligase [uncultured Eubacterium sp.]|uniref:lipoate--protein ligase n=1 Tax=uncultured Eubacterium sp. TaxID=165185 RepID=UPI0025E70F4A|nr:lipoate--protein ligase [uncultured Eubacterium sp.]
MRKKVVFIESNSNDPRFNLALEQYVFDEMPTDREYFWLWQNHNTIVVGKHQNTVQEINHEYVKEHDITVVRRLSGGGAVYHDMGNVNFTFIADAGNMEQLNLQAFCLPVVNTLEQIGVKAEVSGRNDITIDGKKFSGNSQYIKHGRIMHHGTLMFDSDLSVVSKALQVSSDKYESKGFQSVRSRVTNIRPYVPGDMGMETFKSILKKYMVFGSDVEVYHLNEEDLTRIRKIQEERYNTWEWTYGESPEFTVHKKRRIEGCGQIEIHMNVEQGCINQYRSYGDYFGDGDTEELQELLKGCHLNEPALHNRLHGFDLESCYRHLDQNAFIQLLIA